MCACVCVDISGMARTKSGNKAMVDIVSLLSAENVLRLGSAKSRVVEALRPTSWFLVTVWMVVRSLLELCVICLQPLTLD